MQQVLADQREKSASISRDRRLHNAAATVHSAAHYRAWHWLPGIVLPLQRLRDDSYLTSMRAVILAIAAC
jgi:hypothetical protein